MRSETVSHSVKERLEGGRRGNIELPIVIASVLLTASLGQALPTSGNMRPFRVIDRNGALVGYALTENLVAREINGDWVSFYVHTALGIFDSNAIQVYFTTADCSGTRYIPHYSMFAEGTRVGPDLYYPVGPQELNPQSLRVAYANGGEGICVPASGVSGVYGVATTVNVDAFGLQLPFKAVQ